MLKVARRRMGDTGNLQLRRPRILTMAASATALAAAAKTPKVTQYEILPTGSRLVQKHRGCGLGGAHCTY